MVLDEEGAGAKSSLIPSPYFIVLDTNIILDQVSIMSNVSILSTFLYEFSIRLSKEFDF